MQHLISNDKKTIILVTYLAFMYQLDCSMVHIELF